MTTIINAVSGTGITQTADGSGIMKLQSNGVTTNALVWVNFGWNGTTTNIRSSYNVSSVTRVSTGINTINFTNNLTDANYAVTGTSLQYNESGTSSSNVICEYASTNNNYALKTISAVQIFTGDNNADTAYDGFSTNVAIFGN